MFGLTSTSEFSACVELAEVITELTVNTNQTRTTAPATPTHCSLREAINRANSAAGHQTIRFDIAPAGPKTIVIGPEYFTPPLPSITETATLDATTQPGTSGPGAITLDGSQSDYDGAMAGLRVRDDDVTIRGFAIQGMNDDGISVSGGEGTVQGAVIEGNLLGAWAEVGNSGDGISLVRANDSTIGGTTTATRNVVRGNAGHGIFLLDSNGNTIQGNYVGTNLNGTSASGNGVDGIAIEGGSDNLVGGPAAGQGNLISGNTNQGVAIFTGFSSDQTPNGNIVRGNLVGTDAAGTSAIANGGTGVLVAGGTGTLIGGAAAGQGNVISGNDSAGVQLTSPSEGPGATGTIVAGNKIGTAADGTTLLGNGSSRRSSGRRREQQHDRRHRGWRRQRHRRQWPEPDRRPPSSPAPGTPCSATRSSATAAWASTSARLWRHPERRKRHRHGRERAPELPGARVGADRGRRCRHRGRRSTRPATRPSASSSSSRAAATRQGTAKGSSFLGAISRDTGDGGGSEFAASFPAVVGAGDAVTATATASGRQHVRVLGVRDHRERGARACSR